MPSSSWVATVALVAIAVILFIALVSDSASL